MRPVPRVQRGRRGRLGPRESPGRRVQRVLRGHVECRGLLAHGAQLGPKERRARKVPPEQPAYVEWPDFPGRGVWQGLLVRLARRELRERRGRPE